jgi:heme/copper-type cytochrome/quinol oxidase subunit 3
VNATMSRGPLARPPLLGVAMFIASESIFFLAIVSVFVALRSGSVEIARRELDIDLTAIFSLFLWASSGTVILAERRRSRLWLAVTALFGAVFIVGQGFEYARLLGSGIAPRTGLFGTTFFTLTGLHGLHVLVGLAALATLFLIATLRPRDLSRTAWEGVSWYWHFVDAVWVVVFSVVYLGSMLPA